MLKQSDVEYFVNKDKRTVVCQIKDKAGIGIRWAAYNAYSNRITENPISRTYCMFFQSLDNLGVGVHEVIPIESQCKAKAICSPNDKFDVSEGKKLAFAKLDYRLGKHFLNLFYKYEEFLELAVAKIDKHLIEDERLFEKVGINLDERY